VGAADWYNSRVTEDLLREILWVINNKVSDPKLPSMVSVTSIQLAKDTRNATIMISVFGTHMEKINAIKVLNRAAKFIQNTVAKRVKIKNFPRFYFKIDNSFEDIDSVNTILDRVKDDLDRPEPTN
jgi:ribosome-binding factor A